MKVRARYQGEHLSMGYSKGSEYTLDVVGNTIYPNSSNAKPCEYDVEGFLANWFIVEVIHV